MWYPLCFPSQLKEALSRNQHDGMLRHCEAWWLEEAYYLRGSIHDEADTAQPAEEGTSLAD